MMRGRSAHERDKIITKHMSNEQYVTCTHAHVPWCRTAC